MFTETLTYENFDGETVTKQFQFHLGKADLVRLEADYDGGFEALLGRITAQTATGREIMDTLEEVVRRAYGVRVGDAFLHREEDWQAFRYGPAWDIFFVKMFSDPGYSANFVNQSVPKDLASKLSERTTGRVSEQTAQRMDQAARQDPADRYRADQIQTPDYGKELTDARDDAVRRLAADPQAEQAFYSRPPHEG